MTPIGQETIYNSRNYYRLLNDTDKMELISIYNSRNYYRLLNRESRRARTTSTTVEITIGYLTCGEEIYDDIYNSRNYYRLLN